MSGHVVLVGGGHGPSLHQPVTPTLPSHRLETLAMRLTALLVRVLVHLGLVPQAEEFYQYLET